MKEKEEKDWFYTVTEWMVELGLRGTELNLFAIIHGYSQKNAGCCYASRATLAEMCGVASTRTIDAALSSLIEKGLIRKLVTTIEGRPMVSYGGAKNAQPTVQKLHTPPVQNLHTTRAESAHKNKQENIQVLNNNTATQKTTTTQLFVPPTVQEVADYSRTRGYVDPVGFADYFVETNNNLGWKKKNGTPITNWKNCVVIWEKYHKDEVFPKRRPVTAARTLSTLSPIYK